MKRKTVIILVVNIGIVISIGVIALLFLFVAKPFMQGFYCDDTSIAKPYRKSTVPISALYFASLVLAVVCFAFAMTKKRKQVQESNGCATLEAGDYKVIAVDVILLFIIFIYGSGLNMFFTDVGKYSIGRLRPHYLSVCDPDWSTLNCTKNAISRRKELIVGDVICRTNDSKALREAHLSFPSGHASFSGYAATFLILYLESQICYKKWAIIPKYFIQVLIGTAAFYVGLSRVTDYFHHPTDVLAGFGIGVFIAILMHLSLIRFYYPRNCNITKSESNEIIEVESTPINSLS